MTIPSLIQNSNSQAKIAQFKKAFNALSNAYATEFALKSPPKMYAQGGGEKMFNALANQLNVKYYIKYYINRNSSKKEFEKPLIEDNYSYYKYWLVTEDSISYRLTFYSSSIPCASKLIINEKENTNDDNNSANASTCMSIYVDINGFDKSPNTLCNDTDDLNNLKCDQIMFFVASNGITAGNPEKTFAGRIMSSN